MRRRRDTEEHPSGHVRNRNALGRFISEQVNARSGSSVVMSGGEKSDFNCNHRTGECDRKALEDTIRRYDEWAERYDTDVNSNNYEGAVIACNAVTGNYPLSKRREIRILDVGAGTGLIGVYLKKNSFRHIDALDPSMKMLDKLKEKDIYNTIWNDSIGYHQTDIPNDYYDCVVSSGAFVDGHIPVTSIHEMTRIVKPGGIMCIIIREENLTNSLEFSKLEPTFDKLERERKIQLMSRRTFNRYWYYFKGVCYVYKITS